MSFRERTAKNSKILTEHKDNPAIYRAVTCHHTITGDFLVCHTKVGTTMLDESIPLFETAFVEKQVDSLPGGEFATAMLNLDSALTAAKQGSLTFLFQLLNNLFHM